MSEVYERFAESLERLLSLRLHDFVVKYRHYLPKYSIIHYHAKLGDVFAQIKDDKEVMVVVDSEGNIRGILTPMDVISVLLRPGSRGIIDLHFGTAYAAKGRKLPPRLLMKIDVVSVMDKHPLVFEEDIELAEAIEKLSNVRAGYAIVVDSRKKVLAVISVLSIIKIMADLGKTVFEVLRHT